MGLTGTPVKNAAGVTSGVVMRVTMSAGRGLLVDSIMLGDMLFGFIAFLAGFSPAFYSM